jgi:hypothetical protein
MTLDALMLRQKELADRAGQIAAPRQMISPWQGLAQMAQTFVNARQESRTADELTAGRQQLAAIRAGIDLDKGPTAEQISQASLLDPSYADNLTQQSFQAGQQVNQQTFTHGENEAARQAELAKFNRTPLTDVGKIDAELAAGRITPEEATTAKAALAPEGFRPPTQAEIEAYGLKPDQPVRISTKTGKPEAIGGGPSVQLLPSEVGAKLGLADEFLSNFDNVRSEAASGSMTGAIDQPMTATLGRGPGGTAYRQLRQGTEGLVRLMTGAGMPASEAADKAKMYEPTITDDADTLVNKIDGLKAAILRVRSGATAGRAYPEAPTSNPAAQPEAGGGTTYQKGDTATGPNGQKLIFNGTDWVPQ